MCLTSKPEDMHNHPLSICMTCGQLGHLKCEVSNYQMTYDSNTFWKKVYSGEIFHEA